MDNHDKQKIIERYNMRFEKFGYDPRTLGWAKARHRLRYRVLLSQWELDGKSLLDFGCGFGDLYGYCVEHNIAVDYHGLDINPTLIEEGKRRHPAADLRVCDALDEEIDETFDVIVASGVFHAKLEDNRGFVEAAFDFFHTNCDVGFAANFVSSNVDYREEGLNYTDPRDILSLSFKCSRRVILRNDYMPFEFTVFVYKDDAFDKDLSVFPDYLKHI